MIMTETTNTTTTQTPWTIYQKLQWIQLQLKCGKDSYNSFGKYKYRTASAILQAAKPLCQQAGLAIAIHDRILMMGTYPYIEATAGIIDIYTGERYEVTACAREDIDKSGMCNSQISGSASSYARKYALSALFAIDDSSEDPDHGQYQQGVNGYGR